MKDTQKKLYRIILTDTTTMESEVLAEYDDPKTAHQLAATLKEKYWHKGGWISVEEINVADSPAA